MMLHGSLCVMVMMVAMLAAFVAGAPAAKGPTLSGSPLPVFQFTGANGTWDGSSLAKGSLQTAAHSSELYVLPGLLPAASLEAVLGELESLDVALDTDPDSVDMHPTYELYLEKSGAAANTRTIPGKPDSDAEVLDERAPLRARLSALLKPTVDRATRFVNEHYSAQCRQGQCVPCFQLLRRYQLGERTTHRMHFDIQALVTAVISLHSYGRDFLGGLYVSPAGLAERQFMALQAGDACLHQSDLLHGVDVVEGHRWSFIMWFKDAADRPSCDAADATKWWLPQAQAGDALAQFLQAHRSLAPGDHLRWLQASAAGGFRRAQNELGVAYLHGQLGLARSMDRAMELFKSASVTEPEALYNMGIALVHSPRAGDPGVIAEAMELFRQGAERGSHNAAQNLGIGHVKAGNVAEGVRWLEASGEADALWMAATLTKANPKEQMRLVELAAKAGHADACLHMYDATHEVGWLEVAAAAGSPDAQWELAEVVRPLQPKRALRLTRTAATGGSDSARQWLRWAGAKATGGTHHRNGSPPPAAAGRQSEL